MRLGSLGAWELGSKGAGEPWEQGSTPAKLAVHGGKGARQLRWLGSEGGGGAGEHASEAGGARGQGSSPASLAWERGGRGRVARITSHEELEVYKLAFQAAMEIFELTKVFPREETYSLTDQIRRSSRAVCSNIAEAWRKRRYEAAFVSKLNDAEAEAAETQTWLRFSHECNYLTDEASNELHKTYDHIIGKLVNMINKPTPWILRS